MGLCRKESLLMFIIYRGIDLPAGRQGRGILEYISRDREEVSRKAHNLETAVRFGLPQHFDSPRSLSACNCISERGEVP